MSDERDDEQVDPPESPETAESPETPETPEEFEIAEMSPPPPPPDADEPTAMGEPVAPPPLPADPPPDPPVADDLSAVPPPIVPTGPGPDPTVDPPADDEQSWPGSAKAAVAVLVVLALLGVAGTVIGLTRASSTDDDLDEVREELALSEDRVVALEDQLASLGDETGNLSERLDQLTSERDQAVQERDQAVAEREEAAALAEAERALLEAEIESLEAEIESLQAELDEALGGLDELFPLSFSFDLGQLDIAGDYDVSFTEIGCAGLDLCGTPPSAGTATIVSAGGLRLVAPGLFEIPLVVVDGTPFGVADSEVLVGPCGATPRVTSLTMALFDDAIEIDEDGNVDVTALGATIVIDAPAVDECEIGRVWYRAELTARG